MPTDPKDALLSFIGAESRDPIVHRARSPVIAVARDHGAGGEAIAEALGRALQVEVYDKALVDRVAQSADADRSAIDFLDERAGVRAGEWLHKFLYGSDSSPSKYVRHLVAVVVAIAARGGVIVGRGANVILADRPIFRLRITGSNRVCADRLAAAEGISHEEAFAQVREVNKQRASWLWETFKSRHNYPLNYDVVINTDGYPDLDRAAALALAAFQAHRYGPESAESSQ